MKTPSSEIKPFVPPPLLYRDIVKSALMEDAGHGDITTSCTLNTDATGQAEIIAKEEGLLAGLFVAREAFLQVDPEIEFPAAKEEGFNFRKGDILLGIRGRISSMLLAERVALNFLQRLCGIATLSWRYCRRIRGKRCRIVGTRKTTPNLRILEKYAVRAGGALNHRFSLSDGILIKDNHIAACGGVTAAVRGVRQKAPHTLKIEVEVTGIDQLKEAITAGADAVLLDNMEPDEIRAAVALAKGLNPEIILEASGGISLENIDRYADTGVDVLSSGALTHSFKSIDLSLKVKL